MPWRLAWLALYAGLCGWHLRQWRRGDAEAARLRAERPRGRPVLARRPRVSVLVAAWNEAARVRRHVESILALDYPDVEYVLCAGGDDGTFERANEAAAGRAIVLRQEPGEGKQVALRRCLAAATGEIVYLTDGDCLLETADFERLVQMVVEGAGAVTGRSRPLPEQIARSPLVLCQWAPQYVAESFRGDLSNGLLGRNCAVSRAALRAAGDLAEDVRTGTDYHLARRLADAGVPIKLARWSFVATAVPEALGAYVRQQSRWLRNHWIHGRPTGDCAAQRHALQTWAIGVAVASGPLLAVVLGRRALAPWLALVLHGSLARMRYVSFVAAADGIPRPASALALAPASFLIDAFAWTRSLFDLLVPSRRGAW